MHLLALIFVAGLVIVNVPITFNLYFPAGGNVTVKEWPPGWLVYGPDSGAQVGFLAENGYEILPGKSQGGFRIASNVPQSGNVQYVLAGMMRDDSQVEQPCKAFFGYTTGPRYK